MSFTSKILLEKENKKAKDKNYVTKTTENFCNTLTSNSDGTILIITDVVSSLASLIIWH